MRSQLKSASTRHLAPEMIHRHDGNQSEAVSHTQTRPCRLTARLGFKGQNEDKRSETSHLISAARLFTLGSMVHLHYS